MPGNVRDKFSKNPTFNLKKDYYSLILYKSLFTKCPCPKLLDKKLLFTPANNS